MTDSSNQEMLARVNKAQMALKIRLEQVLKLRIDCAKFQLDLLKLYKPQCLEILEMLQGVCAPPDPPDNGTVATMSRSDSKGDEALFANEDVPRKSTA